MLYIFDLDGTLLNTIADLAICTNYALKQCGFPIHPIESYNMFVGNGINNLFLKALPDSEKTPENVQRMRNVFIPFYNEHNADCTKPYPGMVELLAFLQQEGHQIAVASNKYQKATEKLVKFYFPDINFTAVLGQRDGIAIKPNPQIVYDIMAIAKTDASNVIYIGDSGVDMETAQNAGVTKVGVTWGFRSRAELEQKNSDFIVDTTTDIRNLHIN